MSKMPKIGELKHRIKVFNYVFTDDGFGASKSQTPSGRLSLWSKIEGISHATREAFGFDMTQEVKAFTFRYSQIIGINSEIIYLDSTYKIRKLDNIEEANRYYKAIAYKS